MRGNHAKDNDSKRNERLVRGRTKQIVVLCIIACILFMVFKNFNKKTYIECAEKSNIDYKVFLKDNEYYKTDYLDENNQYIANLIDYIVADFNYNMEFYNKNKQYDYTYKIEGTVNVADSKNNNIIYTQTDTLVEEKTLTMEGDKININENLKIDYNKYNNLITEFVDVYDLKDSKNILEINMYVNTIDNMNKSVSSLNIPLTTKTVAIDISNELAQNNNQPILIAQNNSPFKYIILVSGLALLFITIYRAYKLIRYILETRTDETIYNSRKRNILINYGGYIEQVDNYDLTSGNCQIIKVNTFPDLLKIKDELSKPILMIEKEDETGAMFIIPDSLAHIYMFTLNINQELLAENNPVYSGGSDENEE